jgi:hypothetical protein
MRTGIATAALIAGIAVGGLGIHWSGQANREFCAAKITAAEAPFTAPAEASNDQLLYALNKNEGAIVLPSCDPSISLDQIINNVLGAIVLGFLFYVVGLIFSKFLRWAER